MVVAFSFVVPCFVYKKLIAPSLTGTRSSSTAPSVRCETMDSTEVENMTCIACMCILAIKPGKSTQAGVKLLETSRRRSYHELGRDCLCNGLCLTNSRFIPPTNPCGRRQVHLRVSGCHEDLRFHVPADADGNGATIRTGCVRCTTTMNRSFPVRCCCDLRQEAGRIPDATKYRCHPCMVSIVELGSKY